MMQCAVKMRGEGEFTEVTSRLGAPGPNPTPGFPRLSDASDMISETMSDNASAQQMTNQQEKREVGRERDAYYQGKHQRHE
jgi:hypothetical protein